MSAKYVRLTGDKDNPTQNIEVEAIEGDRYRVTIDGEAHEIEAFANEGQVSMRRGARVVDVATEDRGDDVLVQLPRGRARHSLMEERLYKLQVALGGGPGTLKPELVSPMAGKVVLVKTEVGATVEEGDTLLIIEAMKMENEIRAIAPATVKAVHVAAGDIIDPGAVLLEFDFEEE